GGLPPQPTYRRHVMSRRSCSPIPLLAALLAAAVATPLAAQQGGSITGRVTNAATMRPIEGVQIAVEGTGLGTLTDVDGRFLLLNVPAGTATVVIENIGFS